MLLFDDDKIAHELPLEDLITQTVAEVVSRLQLTPWQRVKQLFTSTPILQPTVAIAAAQVIKTFKARSQRA